MKIEECDNIPCDSGCAMNTDKEIWRGPDEGCGDYYADSLLITDHGKGALGINCGGTVITLPIRTWHALGESYWAARAEGRRPFGKLRQAWSTLFR